MVIRQQFKNATIIFMVVHYEFECVRLTLLNLLNIIKKMDDVYLIIINSNASVSIVEFLDKIKSDKVDRIDLPINFGFNHSVNHYIKDFINDENLPEIVLRMDADILVRKNDFEALIDAIKHLKKYGTLALSYEDNRCNPERNVLKPKSITGSNGKDYSIRHTFFCPVAGGIMGIRGEILKNDLNYQMFQPKYLPKRFLNVISVGGADSSLYNALKGKYKVGYIANTKALHMKTRTADIIDIPNNWQDYIDNLKQNERSILDSKHV